ncbi:hypothetical protein StrepF001_14980 [Streptomyces sp. F001]|uniref:hypothetical protein n=1 Tax=Streptomyces sp. F001 TaxID=1510026 RepID=UPI00101E25DA|nr:hypothetical protein [Streptomyces sp. F001]RZB18381.1 hypothetical protein StrepF001_14980 [Streptomyces sp. F001]
MTYATRLDVADASLAVTSYSADVTAWSRRYFGPWWNAAEASPESVCTSPVVAANVDFHQYERLHLEVIGSPHTSTTYARTQLLVARNETEGAVTAVSKWPMLAYQSEPAAGRLTLYGWDTEPVATAAARLAREMMRGLLLRCGWSVLHASAVSLGGRVILTFGSKGAGKTTTALTLAARHGWELLANDRVFVRVNAAGGVDVLPCPAAAAVSLGLLDALGWYDLARERLEAGESLHPTQDQRVTDALMDGRREPLWDGERELKAQVFPDQFPTWFNVGLSTGGQAAVLLFPRIEAGATPAEEEDGRTLREGDFMGGQTEDRYPDVFGLLGVDGGGTADARAAVAEHLAELPHHSVVLGRDMAANADFLLKFAAG